MKNLPNCREGISPSVILEKDATIPDLAGSVVMPILFQRATVLVWSELVPPTEAP